MLKLTTQIDTTNIVKLLDNLSEKNVANALRVCGTVLRKSFLQQFRVEGLPDKWKPITLNTIKRRYVGKKTKQFKTGKILQDTGTLRRSYGTATSTGSINTQEPYRLIIGSSLVYAATHQLGRKSQNIPARPLNVLPESISMMEKAVLRELKKGFK